MIKLHQLGLHKIAFNNPKSMGDGLQGGHPFSSMLGAYSAEIATDSEANRHAFRRKSAVREVGAERRWDFIHSLRAVWVASHVIIFWFF